MLKNHRRTPMVAKIRHTAQVRVHVDAPLLRGVVLVPAGNS